MNHSKESVLKRPLLLSVAFPVVKTLGTLFRSYFGGLALSRFEPSRPPPALPQITSNLREIPRTQALFDQIVESMSSLQRWWLSRLHAEKILHDDEWWPEHRPKDEIYENYLDHCRKERDRHPEKDSQFFKKLAALCPGITSSRIRTEEGRQHRVLFPEIEICRNEFQNRVNITIDWDQDEVPF